MATFFDILPIADLVDPIEDPIPAFFFNFLLFIYFFTLKNPVKYRALTHFGFGSRRRVSDAFFFWFQLKTKKRKRVLRKEAAPVAPDGASRRDTWPSSSFAALADGQQTHENTHTRTHISIKKNNPLKKKKKKSVMKNKIIRNGK